MAGEKAEANVSTELSLADAVELQSHLTVFRLLVGAKEQILDIARERYGSTESITDEYLETEAPDLARTIRLAESMGVSVSIVVTPPESSQS
jgi:hypothetical protein